MNEKYWWFFFFQYIQNLLTHLLIVMLIKRFHSPSFLKKKKKKKQFRLQETQNILMFTESSTNTNKLKHNLFYNISYVTCHLPRVTCNLSPVINANTLPLLTPPLCTICLISFCFIYSNSIVKRYALPPQNAQKNVTWKSFYLT